MVGYITKVRRNKIVGKISKYKDFLLEYFIEIFDIFIHIKKEKRGI
jgi:hypothetical protein